MPAPTTPVGPALASESLANSMSPGIAKAVGIGFLATDAVDAPVTMVSASDPLPTTIFGGVQTDALTDAELRASPVIVSIDEQIASTTVVAAFTSTTSATLYSASASRKAAIIFVPDDSVEMHILFGSGTVSAANRSYTIQPGGAYQVPPEFAVVAAQGIMSSAGNAFITTFSSGGS